MMRICKLVNYFFITTVLAVGFTMLYSCNGIGSKSCPRCKTFKTEPIRNASNVQKPIVNVYMENSGSMFGYVNGLTEFEESVYSYLSDICLNCTDSMNLFYINSRIIPLKQDLSQTARIKDFIKKLSPNHFVNAGVSLGTTDISEMMTSILNKTDDKTVSIFISDCIFSPGRGVDASTYLVNQQIGIKVAFADKLKQDNDFCVKAYQLKGKFKGNYFNRLNQATVINDVRPFYMVLMGREKLINNITKKVSEEKIKGRGVEHSFAISNTVHKVGYEITNTYRIGTFKKCMKSPKYHIINAQKADKGKNQGKFMFTIGTDFSGLPIANDYLLDPENYTLSSKDYELSVSTPKEKGKYSHLLSLTLSPKIPKPGKYDLKIALKKQLSSWIIQCNDEEGLNIRQGNAMQQTYGLKFLFEGIYEAFTNDGNSDFAEIKVFIN